jgi:hypothetical protein
MAESEQEIARRYGQEFLDSLAHWGNNRLPTPPKPPQQAP